MFRQTLITWYGGLGGVGTLWLNVWCKFGSILKEIVHFASLKIARVTLKLVIDMDRKISFSKKCKLGLFYMKNKNVKNRDIFFLERLNNWQKIFESRYNYLTMSSFDLKQKISNPNFIQLNEFNFRQVGF